MADNHHKVLIIGSGPAGLTAAIYAARADLKPVVFEGMQPGGQLTTTNEVENYPGFVDGITGPELMDVLRKQAQRFGAETYFKEVTKADLSKRPFTISVGDEVHTSDSVIIATGASAKYMDAKGIEEYKGYGVSACATCDAFFYRGLKVLVIGGGDTAMEEAHHLTKFAKEVVVVHRRDEFRASKIMEDRVRNTPNVSLELSYTLKEVLGLEENGQKRVTGAVLESTKDGSTKEVSCDGIFMGIGHKPNTDIFKGQLDMNEVGYLTVKDPLTATNIEGVFAAGDVSDDSYRQAITAAGSGCKAALDAERWLIEQE
ncbi:MAG: thioredoxin-disulfide reductase [Melioribacteraceae bacterium]|nr:thioredoxin-disulfide reductase [Melioribacteraceae bacterium]